MSYVLLHALSLAVFAAILYLPGLVAVRVWRPAAGVLSYPHLTRFVLGILFWIAFLFFLAAVQLLRPVPIVGAIVALAAGAAMLEWRRDRRMPAVPSTPAIAWTDLPALAAIALVLGAIFLLALRPTPAWDADTYHLTLPRLYLEHGGFRQVPFSIYSNWPLNIELLYALAMLIHDYVLASSVQWLFVVLIVCAVTRCATLHGRPGAGPVAACLFLANSVVVFDAGIAYVDLAVAFLLLMAVCFVLEAGRVPEHRRWNLRLAGLCFGLMAGAKVSGIVGLGCGIPLILLQARRERRVGPGVRELLVDVVLPCGLLMLPWLIKSAWYTGNPVYPLFTRVFGGSDWNPNLERQFVEWLHAYGAGRSVVDYLLLPARVILQGGPSARHFDGSLAAAWIVLVPAVALAAWKDRLVRRLAGSAGLFFIYWAVASQQMRLLIPAVLLMALAVGLAAAHLIALSSRPQVRALIAVILSAGAGTYLWLQARPAIADGMDWLAQYRVEGPSVVSNAVPPVFQYINTQLPATARLLFLNTNHGFFCEREYLSDSVFQASQINALLLYNRSSDQILQALSARGITHILMGHDRYGIRYPPTLAELLADGRRIRILYRAPSLDVLYAIE